MPWKSLAISSSLIQQWTIFLERMFVKQAEVTVSVDKFGSNRVIRAGFLFGALFKESRTDLTERIEESIYVRSGMEIPILVAREKLFESEKTNEHFVWTTVIRCRENNEAIVSESLNILYGRPSPESDQLRPMLRFIPADVILSSEKTTTRFIQEKQSLDENIIAITLRNMRDLETVVESPPDTPSGSQSLTILDILSNLVDKDSSKKLFHAITPHGIDKDTIILASTKNLSATVRRCRYNLTAVIQETFPWVEDSDIFERQRLPRIMGIDQTLTHEENENYLESFFGFYKEDFPSLSDLEDDDSNNNDVDPPTNQSAWAKGPPPLNPAE